MSNRENDIKIDLRENDLLDRREIGWVVLDWLHLALNGYWWRARVNLAMNLQDP
jgi:hypothetical protein